MAGSAETIFQRGEEFIRPEFAGLDSNDQWVGECGAKGCHGRHNILKNNVMCLPNDQIMNWWEFLDVLKCYERSAQCDVCTRCSWCQDFFLQLLEEAWGLTQNTWRTVDQQFFVAVKFNPHSERYSRRPMTVEPWGRRLLTEEEKKLIIKKEREILLPL